MNARRILDLLVEEDPTPVRKHAKAWLGVKTAANGTFAQVCAHCPDKAQAEAEAEAAGYIVSHGICPDCAWREFGIRLPPKTEAMSETLTPSYTCNKIFFAKSKVCPRGWHFDHVGFITSEGLLLQMSSHRQGIYTLENVSEDPMFPPQKISVVTLPKTLTVVTSKEGMSCADYVSKRLADNGINKSVENITQVMRSGKMSRTVLY